MTVEELMMRLAEEPENAEVFVVDPVLQWEKITAVKYKESTIHEDGVVQICTYW